MLHQVADPGILDLEESLDNDWRNFAPRSDRLERILDGGEVNDQDASVVVVDGLRLLLKQLRLNRVRNYYSHLEIEELGDS